MKKFPASLALLLCCLWTIDSTCFVSAQTRAFQSYKMDMPHLLRAVTDPATPDIEAMYFYNTMIGWVYGPNGFIAKTIDGGATWNRQSLPEKEFILKAFFVNPDRGWACGYNGALYKTTDGGSLWEPLQPGLTCNIVYVFFIDSCRGWIAGDEGAIMTTADGGESWIKQESRTKEGLRSIQFIDSAKGWICGTGGCILSTIDGGTTWVRQDSSTTWDPQDSTKTLTPQNSTTRTILWQICFPDSVHGYAVGGDPWGFSQSSVFLKTSDGGATWQSKMPSMLPLFDLGFINADTGWVIGRGGYIMKTTDGGESWETQCMNGAWLSWGAFLNADTAYVLRPGTFQEILATTNGGKTWDLLGTGIQKRLSPVQGKENALPAAYELMQNYPNPFNPSTTISFSIPAKSYVSLKVFDLMGREAATLVSEVMPAGSYSRHWTAAGHASGLYFYRLQADSYTESRRMLLLK